MSSDYKFKCDSCKFYTNYQSRWTQHIVTEIHKTGKKKNRSDKQCSGICPNCNYTSEINTTLKQHILTKHGTIEDKEKGFSYYCGYCDYGSFSKTAFEKHKQSTKHIQLIPKKIKY